MKTRFPAVRLIGQLFFLVLVAVLLSPSIVMAADSNFSEPKSTPATESGTPAKADQNPVDRVNKVGREISVYCPIEVILSREINAWVTEDRTIHITTGILAQCQSDDEVAGILAHEYGHLQLGHFEEARKRQAGFEQVLNSFRRSMGGSDIDNSDTLENSGRVAAIYMRVRFGHKNEFAADRFAYSSLLFSGKNPMALADLFDRIAKGKIDSKLLSLLSDHPAFSDRIAKFQAYDEERKTLELFVQNTFRLKTDGFDSGVSQGSLAGYRIEPLKVGKKMGYYLLLPEDAGMTYKKGVLELGPTLSYAVVYIRKMGQDNWLEAGIKLGGGSKLYAVNVAQEGDYAIRVNSSTLLGQKSLEVYWGWIEVTKRGAKESAKEVKDSFRIKIVLPKDGVTGEQLQPLSELIRGSLSVYNPN